jgi:threonylcarbamoyladenosine tRNA methylthiotransferase MtaB
MRLRLESIGCRLNISEIETMAREFAAAGHSVVGPGESADLCIFNSCTVTAVAARKSRHAIRQLRRACPDATIVTTGCFSELAPDETRSLGVDLVVGNEDKDRLCSLLHESGLLGKDQPDCVEKVQSHEERAAGSRTRAFLKVQDGCDNRCTFCVVTIARGAGRSRPYDDVVSEVRHLHDSGFKEIVLSGVHLGSYGHDLAERRGLQNLVQRLLAETEIPLEPWDLDEKFFGLFSDSRVLPHLHLPLQSGCDATLRRMARRTDQASFDRLVGAARATVPNVSISTDIMVGFPGETDREFSESISFVESMGFSRLHVFRYSPRERTLAAAMPDQVPGAVARERSLKMQILGSHLEIDFNRSCVGSTQEVLWEEAEEFGIGRRWSGLTDTYIRVVTETDSAVDLTNQITAAQILETIPGGVLGAVEGVSTAQMTESSLRHEMPIVGS